MEQQRVEQILDSHNRRCQDLVEILEDIQGQEEYLSEQAVRAVSEASSGRCAFAYCDEHLPLF